MYTDTLDRAQLTPGPIGSTRDDKIEYPKRLIT